MLILKVIFFPCYLIWLTIKFFMTNKRNNVQSKIIENFPDIYTIPPIVNKSGYKIGTIEMIESIGGNFIAFDLETTGLNPNTDTIIEISAILFQNGKPVLGYTSLINPKKQISKKIEKLTGITNKELKHAPSEKVVISQFLSIFEPYIQNGYYFCAHNSNFDMHFINASLQKLFPRKNIYIINFIDTLKIAKEQIHDIKNYKLSTIVGYLEMDLDSHRSFSDALACGYLLWWCYQQNIITREYVRDAEKKEAIIKQQLESAKEFYSNKNYTEAFNAYMFVIKQGKINITIINQIGTIYLKTNSPEQAITWYKNCLNSGYFSQSIALNWAKAYHIIKDFSSELQILSYALGRCDGSQKQLLDKIEKCKLMLQK